MRADKETDLIIRTTFCYDFLADAIQGLEELKPTIAWGREIGNPWIHKTRVFPQVSVICKMRKACVVPCLRTLQSLHNAHVFWYFWAIHSLHNTCVFLCPGAMRSLHNAHAFSCFLAIHSLHNKHTFA